MAKGCSKCKQVLPLENFSKNKLRVGGFHYWCKECCREYYKTNLREKVLLQKHNYYMENRVAVLARVKARRLENLEHYKQLHRISGILYNQKLKEQVLEAYGGKCTCCGELISDFLTLEHKNHDRKEHLAQVGNSRDIYLDVRKRGFPKDEYTILCMNCNWVTRYGDPCPHAIISLY